MAALPNTPRNAFFQQLKPLCISINNLAVRAADKRPGASELIQVTGQLFSLLENQVSQDARVLDDKLADYVFFPLSNILRNQQEYPVLLTEGTVKCLRILIKYGWKQKLPQELSQQLLILLTFIIGGVPGRAKADIPEETKLESLRCLSVLISVASVSVGGKAPIVDTTAVPALGHAVTVVIETIGDGESSEIQLEALEALYTLYKVLKDHAALASFLPGTVSSLSRLLTPTSAPKLQRRVLVKGLVTLDTVLVAVLGDIRTMNLTKPRPEPQDEEPGEGKILTRSWLKATAGQVKLALSSILKLRVHAADDVREALETLCLDLLDQCHQSLEDCAALLVETALMLSSDDGEQRRSLQATTLMDLASIYPELGSQVSSTVYGWVTSLPRLLQAQDESTKQRAIQNIAKGQKAIDTLRIESSTLNASLGSALRDGIAGILVGTKPAPTLTKIHTDPLLLRSTDLTKGSEGSEFPPILMATDTEKHTREVMMRYLSSMSSSQQLELAEDMLGYVQDAEGPNQLASYWLAFQLVKSTLSHSSALDDFLDTSAFELSSEDQDSGFQELYAFSVAVLDSQAEDEDADWRMRALALEVTTFAASRLGEGFRPELIDVLYPTATLLGSDIPQLREHAIVSLNSMANFSGYGNVTEMIIDNVDYMVNSISLRLNTFDITPASTQVLRMMIRLTGPKLIPYLDDVIASLFAALDNYHGYTMFVETIFSVLREVVDQGAESNTLLLEDKKSTIIDHKRDGQQKRRLEDVYETLDRRSERKRRREDELLNDDELQGHPQEPWKRPKSEDQDAEDEEDGADTSVEKPSPPKTPTYLLLSRITDLTQHYLTSPSPTLRKSLLDLLSTVMPALAPDEEAFLPLVNAIWPVLIERLYDSETYVVISASRALAILCASAGDFLNTRFKTEWWDTLGKWCAKAKREAVKQPGRSKQSGNPRNENSNGRQIVLALHTRPEITTPNDSMSLEPSLGTGLGGFAHVAQVWQAAQDLLVAIVTYIQVDEDIMDQIFNLLSDSLLANEKAREALENIDADMVWLHMYERGFLKITTSPELAGISFVRVHS